MVTFDNPNATCYMRLVLTLAIIFISTFFSFCQKRGISAINKPPTTNGNIYAIIIGISTYKNIKHLQFADKDAKSFENYLLSEGGGNLLKSNIETFLNEKASRTNVGDAISIILKKAKQGDRIYFYFAGHGDMEDTTQKENGLLLLYNSPNGNYFGMNDDVLEVSALKKYLSPLAEKGIEIIFIVDACHSGKLQGGIEGMQQTALALAAAWGKEYKILSCQPNQISLEGNEWGGGRGLFSLQLEDGMKGMADIDNSGVINMYELQNYIQTHVTKYSEGKQIPFITGDLSKPFIKVNPVVLSSLKKQKTKDFPIMDKVTIKGSEEDWLALMNNEQKNLYTTCKQQIANKNLNEAYAIYKKFETTDKVSDASTFLRRNLSASLQEKSKQILSPLMVDVSDFKCSKIEVEQAIEDLNKATQLLGKEHFLYKNLQARILFLNALAIILNGNKKAKAKECIEFLEQSIRLEPNASYSYFTLSNIYSSMQDFFKAEDNIIKYLSLTPYSSWAHNNYGLLLKDMGRVEDAEDEYRKAIHFNPNDPNPVNNYGNLLSELGRLSEAQVKYLNAIQLNSKDANSHHNYACLLFKNKNYEEAEEEYETTIELNPQMAIAHYNYCLLLEKLNRIEEAENECRLAIELNPNDIEAPIKHKHLLEKLRIDEEVE